MRVINQLKLAVGRKLAEVGGFDRVNNDGYSVLLVVEAITDIQLYR